MTREQNQTATGWGLWLRWVLANALGELGLGVALVTGVVLAPRIEAVARENMPWVSAGLAILLGTFVEGVWVGSAQWWALRRALPALHWREWVSATALGACVAWALGMLPSALWSGVAEASGTAPMGEMSATLQLTTGG